MKKTKIAYWIFTVLLCLAMLSTAIPELMHSAQGHAFMVKLGYPDSINTFLGVAKILGIIAILVPGFPRIKEWAYAGFTFDLIGATYAMIAIGQANAGGMVFMLVLLAFLAISY